MIPAYAHISLDGLSSAGLPSRRTVMAPTTHGPGMTGTQACGVRTPIAAAVAAATAGLAGLLHIPNGMMFFMGMLSMMFAAGWLLDCTMCSGVTIKVLGAMPIEHFNIAPLQTCSGIEFTSPLFEYRTGRSPRRMAT